jgi:hypothetical protein
MLSARAAAGIASLIVPMMVSASALAAQNSPATPQERTQDRQEESALPAQPSTDRVEVINGISRVVQDVDVQQFGGAQAGKHAFSTNTVDVINGLSRRTQVLNAEQSPKTQAAHSQHPKAVKFKASQTDKNAPQKYVTVSVINGTRSEMRSLDAAEPPLAERQRQRRQRVVVGVESAESKKHGNAKPVVTAIVTPESENGGGKSPVVVAIASSDSKGDSGELAPEGYWVAPRPAKRPPYHPAPPGSH